MAYLGNLRELLENLLEVIREINKLTRWKKMQKKSIFFCYLGVSIEGKECIHNR